MTGFAIKRKPYKNVLRLNGGRRNTRAMWKVTFEWR